MTEQRHLAHLAAAAVAACGCLSLAAPLAAVEPNLRLHVDRFPLVPLERVLFGINAGPVALASLTAQGFPNATVLEAADAWDFCKDPGSGSCSHPAGVEAVTQFAPLSTPPAWSCLVPNGCAGLFSASSSDILMTRDDYTIPRSRDALALDYDGADTILLRGQVSYEADPANELVACFRSPTVPFLKFPNLDGTRRYMQQGDPAWSSALFNCVQAATLGSTCGNGGTQAYLKDGNGALGRVTGRVVRAGTLTLPSRHVVDTLLVEVLASFQAYGLQVGGNCLIEGPLLRQYLLLWLAPEYGPLLQVTSPPDTASLDDFTATNSTVLSYGLLPPVSIRVTGVGPDWISVAWDPGDLGANAPDGYTVHWGEQPGSQVPPPFSASTTRTSYTVSGLALNTRYCISVSSTRDYLDPVSGVTTTYRSIALPASIGADADGNGQRDPDHSYPPEACAVTGQSLPDLLRADMTEYDPPTPPKSQILPPSLVHIPGFQPGSLDPGALRDTSKKLMFYAYAPPAPLLCVKSGGEVRIE